VKEGTRKRRVFTEKPGLYREAGSVRKRRDFTEKPARVTWMR
jgi:hypothetical protein